MSSLTLRPATVGDAADIHTLLLGAGHPARGRDAEQEEALYAQLRKTLAFGGPGWRGSGRVVGVVLAENVQTGRHWGENGRSTCAYAVGEAVDALLNKVLERSAPIAARVKETNRTGLAARLERLGFRKIETRLGERHFRREPGGTI